jgi:hypothetical protein
VDLFGDANIVEPDSYHIVTTDANGMAEFTVESIATGTAEINVDVLSIYGDVTVGPAYLVVVGTTGDLADVVQSDIVIDPIQIIDKNYFTQGTITLRNSTGEILANKLIGLRIKSDRNYLPDTPYAVDHFFDTDSIVHGIVPVVTDDEGCIHVPIETVVAGTAHITAEISSTTGWLLIGRQTVQFDDADGDDIPDVDDEYPNDDDRRDCDCDGQPDTVDPSDGADDDGDGIPNFCDRCAGIDDTLDGDCDGIADEIDNCPSASNPLQCDTDNDGFGNACDQDCPNLYGLSPVNFQDFSVLSADWNQSGGCFPGDLDGNEVVDRYDLARFALYWLVDCY